MKIIGLNRFTAFIDKTVLWLLRPILDHVDSLAASHIETATLRKDLSNLWAANEWKDRTIDNLRAENAVLQKHLEIGLCRELEKKNTELTVLCTKLRSELEEIRKAL